MVLTTHGAGEPEAAGGEEVSPCYIGRGRVYYGGEFAEGSCVFTHGERVAFVDELEIDKWLQVMLVMMPF